MSAPERAPLGAALALLLTVVSLTGDLSPALMAAVIGVLGLLIGLAWPDLLELPSPLGTRIVVGGTGLAGALITLLPPRGVAPTVGVLMVCAVGVFAAFAHQMLRRERTGLTASLTGTIAGVFVAGVAPCWVLAQHGALQESATGLVTAIAVGLAVTLLINATGLPGAVRFPAAVVLGSGVTVALTSTLTGIAPLIGSGLGLMVSIGACAAHLLLGSSLVSKAPAPSIAVAAGPVATVAVVAHFAVVWLL